MNLCTVVGLYNYNQYTLLVEHQSWGPTWSSKVGGTICSNSSHDIVHTKTKLDSAPPPPPLKYHSLPPHLLILSHAMDPPNGLQFGTDTELGLHQQDMGSLHNVQALGARPYGQQKDIDISPSLEGCEMSLERNIVLTETVRDVVGMKTLRDVTKDFIPLSERERESIFLKTK